MRPAPLAPTAARRPAAALITKALVAVPPSQDAPAPIASVTRLPASQGAHAAKAKAAADHRVQLAASESDSDTRIDDPVCSSS